MLKRFNCLCCNEPKTETPNVIVVRPQKGYGYICIACEPKLDAFNANIDSKAVKMSTAKKTANYYQLKATVKSEYATYFAELGYKVYIRLNHCIVYSEVEEGFRRFSSFDKKYADMVIKYSIHCIARIGNRDGENDCFKSTIEEVRKWRDRCIR